MPRNGCASKRAPIPVPGYAMRCVGSCREVGREAWHRVARYRGRRGENRARWGIVQIRAGETRRLAIGSTAPLLELGVTVLTRATDGASGVVVCILVKRDGVGAVEVTENVATLAAVMPARPRVEGLFARGVITDRRLLIGLSWSSQHIEHSRHVWPARRILSEHTFQWSLVGGPEGSG